MSRMGGGRRDRTPWHLWVVGVLSLLWNGFGCYDYTMTNLRGDTYLREFGYTDEQVAYFNAMPAWMTAAWAIGVWGGLLGSLLLLLRRRWAVPAYAVSLLAVVVSLVHGFLLSDMSEVMGTEASVVQVVIFVLAALLLWYSSRMAKRGVLR